MTCGSTTAGSFCMFDSILDFRITPSCTKCKVVHCDRGSTYFLIYLYILSIIFSLSWLLEKFPGPSNCLIKYGSLVFSVTVKFFQIRVIRRTHRRVRRSSVSSSSSGSSKREATPAKVNEPQKDVIPSLASVIPSFDFYLKCDLESSPKEIPK